jgi:ankyrin repeat protein
MKLRLLFLVFALNLTCFALVFANTSPAAVLESISAGDLSAVKKFKTQKGDLNVQNQAGITLLMQAVATGQKAIVQYLLQQKVKLETKNENGDTALMMAIGNDQDQLAVDLIKAGAKIDVLTKEEGSNLVYKAASVNSKKALALLLKKDLAQVNAANKKGDTALHEAARYGSVETIKTLLKAGAKKDLKNNEGKTPLDLATELKVTVAQKLLK